MGWYQFVEVGRPDGAYVAPPGVDHRGAGKRSVMQDFESFRPGGAVWQGRRGLAGHIGSAARRGNPKLRRLAGESSLVRSWEG